MKKLSIRLPRGGPSFDVALFPGTSDRALQRSVAARAGVPAAYWDGSESFYLTKGGANDMVIPLCADGLPDGQVLVMHVLRAPPGAPPAAVAGAPDAGAAAAAAQKGANAEKMAADAVRRLSVVGLRARESYPDGNYMPTLLFLQNKIRGYLVRQRVASLRRNPCDVIGHLRYHTTRCLHETDVGRAVLQWLPGQLSTYERLRSQHEDEPNEGMLHMSKLATDMANERTLLAWIRTVLAIMRTAFATLGMTGVTATWVLVNQFSLYCITTLMAASCGVGIYRYYKIRHMLMLKSVPDGFKRTPMWPLVTVLGAAVIAVAAASYAQGIDKAGGTDE